MTLTRTIYKIGVLSPLLLLASCGKQQQAKSLAKEFVKDYATQEIDINSFSDLDSTHVISDSILNAMRQNLMSDPLFKSPQLAPLPLKAANGYAQTMLYIRMRYQLPGDTLEESRTFYFDRELKGIIAVK